jgi:hypothetical protein
MQQTYDPNLPPRPLSDKRDAPLRASHLDLEGESEAQAYYHHSQQHSLGDTSPPHSPTPPTPRASEGRRSAATFSEPLPPSGARQPWRRSEVEVEEDEDEYVGGGFGAGEPPELTQMAGLLSRPSQRGSTAREASTEGARGRTITGQRGSTPRGSSLDGGKKQAADSPSRALTEKSSYVRHLEAELATLRADRSSLMQTILDLKQENEEHAQAAAMVDDDHDDIRESLAGRINELNSALRKANASIKLMRQANHTLKV